MACFVTVFDVVCLERLIRKVRVVDRYDTYKCVVKIQEYCTNLVINSIKRILTDDGTTIVLEKHMMRPFELLSDYDTTVILFVTSFCFKDNSNVSIISFYQCGNFIRTIWGSIFNVERHQFENGHTLYSVLYGETIVTVHKIDNRMALFLHIIYPKHIISPTKEAPMFPTDGPIRTTRLPAKVQNYVSAVYSLLGVLFLTFMGGIVAGIHSSINQQDLSMISFIGALLSILFMAFTTRSRALLAMLVSLFLGIICAPAIEVALYIDETAVLITMTSSILMFFSISACAYTMPIKSMFQVGSLLSSLLTMSLFVGTVGLFVEAEVYHLVHIWLSLCMFLGFILYDTQLMIERAFRRMDNYSKNPDYVFDALNLFLDFANMFIRILAIIVDIRKKLRDRDN